MHGKYPHQIKMLQYITVKVCLVLMKKCMYLNITSNFSNISIISIE